MNIRDLAEYTKKPVLFSDGTAIMWTDPYISRNLLSNHINPDHDIASRSNRKIEMLVEWILSNTKHDQMKILDLGCGPGLYAEKLAKFGHHVIGIDYSKNSIDYAEENTRLTKSGIEYYCKNYLEIDYEEQFDLVILIYLDFCVLKPWERKKVLYNIYRSLKKGGRFIFDVVNSKNIDSKVLNSSWEVCANGGFWKDEPYIVLNTGYHYPEQKVFVNQHIVMDRKENKDTYLFWTSYYDQVDIIPILMEAGFMKIDSYENVLPLGDQWNGENVTFYVVEK